MHKRFASLIALLLALTGTSFIAMTAVSAGPAQAKDANCSDFNTQAAAQQYFINHGGPNSDPDGLDSDGDGIACESNPCPCSDDTGGGGSGNPPTPAKRFHVIHLRVAKVSGNVKVLGKIPTYRGKFQIQRKLAGKKFVYFTRTQTRNPGGKVQIRVQGPKGACFKVSVPATPKYKLTTKEIGCIR